MDEARLRCREEGISVDFALLGNVNVWVAVMQEGRFHELVDEVRRLRAALREVIEHTAGYQDIEPAYDAYIAARAALEPEHG